jgi:hypothetical protein
MAALERKDGIIAALERKVQDLEKELEAKVSENMELLTTLRNLALQVKKAKVASQSK